MKTLLNLYVDAELKQLAKQRGINMSKFFNSCLEVELNDTVATSAKEEILQLKVKLGKLTGQLEEANKTIEVLQNANARKEENRNTIY